MKHTVQEELRGVTVFVGAIWVVFLLELVSPVELKSYGVTPRTGVGLIGIGAMPFLHADWQHLTGNTPPLVVLLVLLAGSRANSRNVVASIIVIGGALLWVFGRAATHIGASNLIFGLIVFLIVSGLLEKRLVPLLIAIVVGVVYGGSLLSGIVPQLGSRISWDGHLCGSIAGGLVAYAVTLGPKPPAK